MNEGKLYMPYAGRFAGVLLLGLLAAGCDRANNAPKPITAPQEQQGAGPSIALPPSSLPPSDASLKPAAPQTAEASGQASNQTQANPRPLNKQQQSAAMPMPGQTNNFSTTESNEKQSPPAASPK